MEADRSGRIRGARLFHLWWLSFALALVLGASPSAASELEVGEPLLVDTEPSWGPLETVPAGIASDGDGWLALGLTGYDEDGAQHERLHGTRISAEGIVLDTPGFAIAEAAQISVASLSFDGTHYVAVWAERSSPYGPRTIRLQRIAVDGTLAGESVTLGSGDMGRPLVASGPDSTLVVWCANSFESGLCSWVQVEGTTVVASDSMPFAAFVGLVSLSASGDSWLIATQSDGDICLIQVGSDGLALGDAPAPIANGDSPMLAAAESGWVALWREDWKSLRSARVGADGSVAVAATPLLNVQNLTGLAIARTTEGFVITAKRNDSEGGESIAAFVFDHELSPLLDPVTLASGIPYEMGPTQASWGGSSVLVNWSHFEASDVFQASVARRLSAAGTLLDEGPQLISVRPNTQKAPAAAYGPEEWLVAWTDDRNYTSWDVYAQRLDPSGTPLSQGAIRIGGNEGSYTVPAVAGSPEGWLVAWTDGAARVKAARVDPSGNVLDRPPIDIGVSYVKPAVVFDGTDWVVGWISTAPGENSPHGVARIVRIDASGHFVDSESINVSSGSSAKSNSIDLEVDATGYQVSWVSDSSDVLVRHVDFSGFLESNSPWVGGDCARHDLEYRDGHGWLLCDGAFKTLGSDLPKQMLFGYDLVSVGQEGLAAWPEGGVLHLGLAPVAGALKSKAEVAGPIESPNLAVKSADTALLSYATTAESLWGDNGIFVRLVNVTESEDGEGGAAGAPVETGGAPGSGGAGGTSGHSSGGAAGAPAEGGAPSGSAGERNGESESGGERNGGPESGGEAGHASGGTTSKGDGSSSESDKDRYVACTCRVGSQTKATAVPWLTLLLGLTLRARRRQRP